MGQEINRTAFDAADFDRFHDRLRAETGYLADIAAQGLLSRDGYVIGFEVEAWLLDHGFYPKPDNERFLAALDHPLAVPELSRFNVELNCEPLALTGNALARANAALTDLWRHCNHVAHGMDVNMVMIGTLPIIRDADLTLANMTPQRRYAALNAEILRRRDGRPLSVDISGEEHLVSEHRDVMLEAAATSFQIHLKTPAALAHRFYNASIMASAPLLAAAVNAPFLFRKSLWQETRIPLFEQAVGVTNRAGTHGRVTFGTGYLESSMVEALTENLAAYPVLLPMLFDEPEHTLAHLRLHNGTVWRWNRPLVGFEADGTAHLRIEHRPLPAGPTIIDMIANTAAYVGLVRQMVDSGFDERAGLSFSDATANFYAAARDGLEAEVVWPEAGLTKVRDLLLDNLIPAARRGLDAFGIAAADRDLYLGIVEARVRSGQTGAAWQRAELSRRNGDFRDMMASYCDRQRGGAPVHQWEL